MDPEYRLKYLQERLDLIPQASYPFQSRSHQLKSFIFPSTTCFVKRDDELGFGVSGSKIRKYRSIIPYLIQNQIKDVILIGSAYSNHILSFSQLLIENEIRPLLFLRGDPSRTLQGNALLISLFIPPSSIHWFSKSDWKNVESKAYAYSKQHPRPFFVIPEGGFIEQALPGALSLALDVLRNEHELGLIFDHLFIEAGTGFTASSVLLALAWLNRSTFVHIFLLAENALEFMTRLELCHKMFTELMQKTCPFPHRFILHYPQVTGHFGQTNPSIFKGIKELATAEGFLTDPVYSAKLFLETKHLLSTEKLSGNMLIHHAGGALTLMGFQEQIQKLN